MFEISTSKPFSVSQGAKISTHCLGSCPSHPPQTNRAFFFFAGAWVVVADKLKSENNTSINNPAIFFDALMRLLFVISHSLYLYDWPRLARMLPRSARGA